MSRKRKSKEGKEKRDMSYAHNVGVGLIHLLCLRFLISVSLDDLMVLMVVNLFPCWNRSCITELDALHFLDRSGRGS